MKVFISWSGERSRAIADILRDWLKDVLRDIEPFISTQDIYKGEQWLDSITKELDMSDSGIICVTPENLYSSWLLFEAGALSKSLGDKSSKVIPFLFEIKKKDIKGPLSTFQAVEYSEEDVFALIKSLNLQMDNPVKERRLEKDFEAWWPKLNEQINTIEEEHESKTLIYIENIKRKVGNVLSSREIRSALADNKYFSKVFLDSIDDFSSRIINVSSATPEIKLPYILYPCRLIGLLMEYKVTVKALALIDVEEKFWRDKAGLEILRNTDKNSTRIFVFHNRKQMMETIPTLYQHSEKYNVGAISYDNLVREWPDYAYDFSIIGDIGTRLLARYDVPQTESLETNIRFTTNKTEISGHEDIINSIIQKAYVIDRTQDVDKQLEETFQADQFKYTSLERKTIEMSAYISIPQYDQFEEQHAYYVEMMNRMLEIFEERRANIKGKHAVLEFGSGTGLFTKRIATKRNTNVTAIEIDWACFSQLEHNLKKICTDASDSGNIKCYYEDSRVYNPPGTFHFIFSSFADHHIKPYDKMQYFGNIARNLKKNGFAIIGDEFLPTYDRSNVEARRKALKKYHKHIIDIAKNNKQMEMAELEEAALKSGLEEVGDFKLSCEEYEDLLTKAGFLYEKEKIGPKEDLGVGGVYIYILERQNV